MNCVGLIICYDVNFIKFYIKDNFDNILLRMRIVGCDFRFKYGFIYIIVGFLLFFKCNIYFL